MKNVFHIRLSRYIADWVISKYGSVNRRREAVAMPTAHPAGRIVYRNLVSNTDFVRWTHNCYCQMMMDNRMADMMPSDLQSQLPVTDCDSEVYVAFQIPEAHYYDGRLIPCDDTMQLDSQHATEFIQALKEEFWEDFEDYAVTYFRMKSTINAGRTQDKERSYAYDMTLDFCDFWHIDNDACDSIYRQMHRLLKEGRITIDNKPKKFSSQMA